MITASNFWRVFVLALGIAGLSGCGGSGIKEGNFKVTPVTGKVTLDGAPLADADVSFHLQGTAPTDYLGTAAKTDAQGNFEVLTGTRKGAPAGTFKITVSKWVGPDGKVPDPAAGMDIEQLKAAGSAVQLVPAPDTDVNTTTIKEITVEDGKPLAGVEIALKK